MPKKLIPGTRSPFSGQVEIVGPRGGNTNIERTIVKDKIIPPPLKPGQTYKKVDGTKNKAGRGK